MTGVRSSPTPSLAAPRRLFTIPTSSQRRSYLCLPMGSHSSRCTQVQSRIDSTEHRRTTWSWLASPARTARPRARNCWRKRSTVPRGAVPSLVPTTPDAISTQRILADARAAGAAYAAMEVSSHALEQGRVEAIAFAVAVFTNLSRDHLDYHGDMESYAAAKTRLFERDGLTAAVINRDDVYGRELIVRLGGRVRVITYGLSSGDIHALAIDCAPDGLRVRAMTPRGELDLVTPLLGRFNAYNLLATLATLLALGVEPDDCAQRLSKLRPVPGRVERFQAADHQPLIVVDYAHTPDALEQVLQALRPHVAGKLWCVFGCGGDRDRGKRPQMGAIAERLADHVILTDDNPRSESGDAIVQDIAAGMRSRPRIIRERKAAIVTAVSEASVEDVILVAGKGHEDYQQVGETRHPYSDRDTVRALLGIAA
jgi:UDP-N-acetylmuramoyl-L-alanyl-D-glutamate--2,6-diaminopimelate ligase